jgi:hypothetical protein
MSALPEHATSLISRYATRGAVVYYALVLPAIVLEAVFSVAIASTPGDLVSQTAPYGGAVTAAARLLPLAILAASAYAVFSFRPSVLIAMLIASFFVAVSVANGITLLGARLDLGDTVILVIAATFFTLAGFSYARGLKLLGGRRAQVRSSGPLSYNVVGIALDSAFPLATALGLVLLVEAVVAALAAQTSLLPEPLSALASIYLQTRIGIVFTTLFVAGAAIWVMRQFVEPVILHFTLSASDARRELLSEIEPTAKSVGKIARYRPSKGLAWGVMTVAYCAGIFAALALFVPRAEFFRDLLATLNLRAPPPSHLESLLQGDFQNGLVRANILFARSQDYIREIVRLLWG